MNLYFVVTDKSKIEAEVTSVERPQRLLLSYFYYRSKGIAQLIKKIGYLPIIRLDSGAFSAFNTGRNISPIDYMNFIDENEAYIDDYIALDVIGDPELTRRYYEIMRYKGYSPIPVFHYGDDEKYLRYYLDKGHTTVALGGTAMMRSKPTVAAWCSDITGKYPGIEFHLLGSSSRQITDKAALASCDSSTWIVGAFNGNPKHITGTSREKKKLRAEYNMATLMKQYEEAN